MASDTPYSSPRRGARNFYNLLTLSHLGILRSDLCRTSDGSTFLDGLAEFKSYKNLKIFHQNPNVILPFNSLREHGKLT